MRLRPFQPRVLISLGLLLGAAGCESYWTYTEPVADTVIPPRNPFSLDTSRQALADRVGQPHDVTFFGDQAVYMGDKDGYRYVHVRNLFGIAQYFGECDYKVPESQWPMQNPMPLTEDASKWQNVSWLNGDAPAGVAQNAFLQITPSFPLGTPQTKPSTAPTSSRLHDAPATFSRVVRRL